MIQLTAEPTLPRPELVLIDLDGTLVDSVRDIAAAADDTLEALGRRALGEERIRGYVGNGVECLVHRCLTDNVNGVADDEDFERAFELFVGLYDKHNGRHSVLYPGVTLGLDWLTWLGVRLCCVTNKTARFTEPLLRRLGLLDYFDLVVSGDSVARKKPDPEPLLFALQNLGVQASEALLIGDSVNDVRAGRAAGIRVVCVTYGYNHGTDVRECRPDAVIDSLVDLRTLIA